MLRVNSVGTDAALPEIYEDPATLRGMEVEFGFKKEKTSSVPFPFI